MSGGAPSTFRGATPPQFWGDVGLGEAVGYERPRDIHKLIERLADNLATLGPTRHPVAPSHEGRGSQPVTEYLLGVDHGLSPVVPSL